ncbi:MAG: putative lipid II flippase FtsW [bacterium]|nr:putative lipid II flippase FtsW [bacterium]
MKQQSTGLNKTLLYVTAALFWGGLLVVFSASMVLSQKRFGSVGYYTMRQLIYGGVPGIIFMLIASKIPYTFWRKVALPLMILSFVMLALLFLPTLGFSFGGATRWLKLGPITFQPSEILKLTFVIYLASWLDARRQEIASVSYGLIPFAMMLSFIGIFLIMQPDFGTLGIIVISAGLLYFLGGGKTSQIVTLSALGLVLAFLLVQIAPYRMNRLNVFLNPDLDPKGIGYHANQASIAIGSGGFWGVGFGKGLQKYNYLPEPMGDSIFAIFAEEMGFLGVMAILFLFAIFFRQGIKIAKGAPDSFGQLLAGGITLSIATQVFINIAAISGLFPLTGIPLPFFSYGGTSLGMTLAGVGILLNISKYERI